MKNTKSIQAELLKLKYPPIRWLIGFIILSTLLIVFSAHYIDIHKTVSLGVNPWFKLLKSGQAIFSLFISIPFVILLISAIIFIEHQNNGFKQLYTLAKSRAILITYKIIAFLIFLLGTIVILFFGLILIGYILQFIYPETEFIYYNLPFWESIKSFGLIFISLLGIIGIQVFLSLRFKSFLVPASFGILAFIFGLLLASINHAFALYCPYSYPMIARESNIFNNSSLEINSYGLLNNVEIYSILTFIIFLLLSLFLETKKNI